jgi:hypothetical protein
MMAEKKAVTGSSEPSTESVVKLLASILNEVQKQVQRKTPKPLEGVALEAVERFRDISSAIALQQRPAITTFRAEPQRLPSAGKVRLIWSSTNAQTVSINQNVGEVEPAASGSIEVSVATTTDFTATAKGACGTTATQTTRVTIDD